MKLPVAREGAPYIFGALVLAGAAFCAGPAWAAPPLAAALFIAFFFREPRRVSPGDEAAVVAPADGRVVQVDEVSENGYLHKKVRRISIFLSVFDVHVNYSPVSGTVDYMHYRRGSFKNAMKDIASVVNENNTIGIKSRETRMALRQIAGMIARRIVCRCTVGDSVRAGDAIGLIKFGSRVDVFLPLDYPVSVATGDRVRGGETMIARAP